MFGERVKQLEKYAQGVADIQLSRNPLASEVVLIFNETIRDQYQDAITNEIDRVVKVAMVSKDPSMSYVQELFDDLLEDDLGHLPWAVSLTMTNLPRRPSMDDQILIDGLVYSISKVTPLSRKVQSIITLAIYPERTEYVDDLAIFKASVENGMLSIVYGGAPLEMSFDGENWKPFKSSSKVDTIPQELFIRDKVNTIRYAL